MLKKKYKHYLVTLVTNDKRESMQVRARSKKEAMDMVKDVVMKCSLFNYKEDEFTLTCCKYKEEKRRY